jgi:hypothetical protein
MKEWGLIQMTGRYPSKLHKFTPFFLYEHINNNKQRKEKEAKTKENQQHTNSLLYIFVNKSE